MCTLTVLNHPCVTHSRLCKHLFKYNGVRIYYCWNNHKKRDELSQEVERGWVGGGKRKTKWFYDKEELKLNKTEQREKKRNILPIFMILGVMRAFCLWYQLVRFIINKHCTRVQSNMCEQFYLALMLAFAHRTIILDIKIIICNWTNGVCVRAPVHG